MMRRVFPLFLLLATPLLVNCADSATPVAPAGAVLSEGDVPTEGAVSTEDEWAMDENWWTPGDVLAEAEEEMSALSANASAPNVMVLGNTNVGTSYPNGAHDNSFHAKDRMIPGTVVIDAGETVTFQVMPGHRMAIYNDGMKPEDILNTNPGNTILYPVNRLFLQPNPVHPKLKFMKPGKYLVICVIKNHFYNANMWGWLIVR